MAISYSAQGAAKETGLSETFIRAAVREGKLQGRYANSKLIIEHSVLVAWVESLPTDKEEWFASSQAGR